MRIVDIEVRDTPAGGRLAARVEWDRRRLGADSIEYLYRDVPAREITGAGNALVASFLLPAMAVGEDITVEAPVSRKLLTGLAKIASIYKEWYPKLHRTKVHAPTIEPVGAERTDVASFFSGGMDSFHTILRDRPEPITTLFSIVGLDLRFEKRRLVPAILPRLERAAAAMGRRMIVVDSNAYEVGHKYLFRSEHLGGFLASVPLALGGKFGTCLIPSSWAIWRWQLTGGSNPATDPLWSTEALEFVHDGAELSRVEKGLAVGDDPVLLEHLRVCVRRPDLYNCRRCSKCTTTTLILHAAGTLDRCATLGPLDVAAIGRAPATVYERNLRELAFYIDDPEIRRAMRRAVRLGRIQRRVSPLVDVVRRLRLRARLVAFERQEAV